MTTHQTACILCSRNCGLKVEIDNGKFVKIQGDEAHPISRGYICQKAARLDFYQNHDDRLKYPLKKQSDGTFQKISWDEALSEIAEKLENIRKTHGGKAFAFVGGGGQGNHWGGIYSRQLLSAMDSRFIYSALAQEKTGDFWVNGRMFGSQQCHTTEDIEHADYVLFIGTNPYQAHGIPNARNTLREITQNKNRTMVVIDPRVSETAKMADVHLQLKPGTDAFLLSAMLSIIVRENLHDKEFLENHCTGFAKIEKELLAIDAKDYAKRADVSFELVEKVARDFASAKNGCVRIDLGIQHTLHTTLNGYLEKLLYLLTGNFGKKGGNNLHTFLIPLISDTDERKKGIRTAKHQMFPIGGLYPPNILPDEINHDGEDRIRAVWVDSANPVSTYADSNAYVKAFEKLELLVAVDVAMTETARLADYVLPAASQFEKLEATAFNLEFPENFFHLRKSLFEPLEESLPEPEIYTRLLEKMGAIPANFPILSNVAKMSRFAYLTALQLAFKRKPALTKYASSVMYRTLGKTLPKGCESAAPLLGLTIGYAARYFAEVKNAGFEGNRRNLGNALFDKILGEKTGVIISKHEFADVWKLIKNKDRKIHLEIPEMLEELRELKNENFANDEFPFILMAGERRSYNANQIYRNPEWRKIDKDGAMRIHPEDAAEIGVENGAKVVCSSAIGSLNVSVEIDASVRRKMVTLPNGYGLRYNNAEPTGPQLNLITPKDNCEPLTKTPFHKYLRVKIEKII